MKSLITSLCLVIGLGTTVFADKAIAKEVSPSPELKRAVQKVISDPTVTLTYFEGPEGLIGVGVTTIGGERAVVFADKSGRYLFSGPTFDLKVAGANEGVANATNTLPLNAKFMSLVPKPDSKKLLQLLSSAKVITTGNAGAKEEYFVIADPKCPWCHKTWKGFSDLIAKGFDIKVNWIMVGILSPTSEQLVKMLLAGDGDKAELLKTTFESKTMTPIAEEVAKGEPAYAENQKVWNSLGFKGVPDTFYKNGDSLTMVGNMPNFVEIEKRLVAQRSLEGDTKVGQSGTQ